MSPEVPPKGRADKVLMETIASGYGLPEALRVDAAGDLYFTDAAMGGVYRLSPRGGIETILPRRKGVGGLLLHADGGVVVSGRDVIHIRESGETRFLFNAEGVLGWNDMIADARGRVYVGSMRSSALQNEDRVPGELWRIDGEGRGELVYEGIAFANGVGLSPDGRTIYHSNYSEGTVLAHDFDASGRGVNRRVFAKIADANPDGLAVDETGGVWVAMGRGGGIAIFTPDGTLARVLDVPATFVASLCFGGADRRDLYICTMDNTERPERMGTIFRTRSEVPGLPVPLARV
jgi:D-xylonolactonase